MKKGAEDLTDSQIEIMPSCLNRFPNTGDFSFALKIM